MTSVLLQTIVSMPFAENTYVAWLEDRPEALVIDPGLEPELILDFLRQRGLEAAAILNTHGHADHIGGNEALKQAFPQAPLVIGPGDERQAHRVDEWIEEEEIKAAARLYETLGRRFGRADLGGNRELA